MVDVYIGIGIFVGIYLTYLLIIVSNKKRLDKYIKKSREVNLLKNKYNLNYDKINHKLVANLFGLTNGLIIGGTYILIMLIENIILKFLIALVFMTIAFSVAYTSICKYLKKKEVK